MRIVQTAKLRLRRRIGRALGHPERTENERWQRKWSDESVRDKFHWRMDTVPEQLVDLLQSSAPAGVAVDLGCGDGLATNFLAEHFDVAIGLDIALQAVALGRNRPRRAAEFAVGDVQSLPLRSNSVDFVFDRGCLHLFDDDVAHGYLEEIGRVTRSGASVYFIEKTEALDRALRKLPSGMHVVSSDRFVFDSREGSLDMTAMLLTVDARGERAVSVDQ